MDYLVNLYHSDFLENAEKLNINKDFKFLRVLPPQKNKVLKFIKDEFGKQWAAEAEMSFSHINPTIFVAVKNKEVIGFSCYDATAKGFFGPIGVNENFRKDRIGETLTFLALKSMKDDGYGYAIIGSAKHARGFYNRFLDLEEIETSENFSIYDRMF